MATKELKQTEKVAQKIQLVKGEFTPSEASHIITNLIDDKINFHKIQRLQMWEGNHKCKTDQLDNRIKELEKEKVIAKEFINSIRSLGQNLKIDGVLEISVAK
jgi:DNA-binding HxlR family transcriptional regulator